MVHTSRMTNVLMALTLLWAASQSKPLSAAPLTLPDVPLVVSTTVSPNIILLLDNSGSMSNIVPDTPLMRVPRILLLPVREATPSTTASPTLIPSPTSISGLRSMGHRLSGTMAQPIAGVRVLGRNVSSPHGHIMPGLLPTLEPHQRSQAIISTRRIRVIISIGTLGHPPRTGESERDGNLAP